MSATQMQEQAVSTESFNQKPTPERFFETTTAYQRTAALNAAIDLDLFTAVGEGQSTIAELAQKVGGRERAVRILCDSLVVLGFLIKHGNNYRLAPDSAMFLDRRSPAFAGSARNFMGSSYVVDGFRNLAAIVRSGPGELNNTYADDLKESAWVEFARSMAPLSHVIAMEVAKLVDRESRMKVLDVAAGHGLFGIAIAQQNPNAAIVALDRPNVLVVAEENARRLAVAERYQLLPGDALEVDLGNGFDVVLMPNVMHLWDRQTNVRFLKKVKAALAPKGRVIIIDFVPEEDRVSPAVPALFALSMLVNTTAGDVYTASEHRSMLTEAGFGDCQLRRLIPTPQTAIIALTES
jgi:ubiquinone/menaquinone biosynthesis C-methylase UbiE